MLSSTLEVETLDNSIAGWADCFVHVWPVSLTKDGERQTLFEVEINGSHSSDPNHIDPSCPQCRRLRSMLYNIATRVVASISSDVRNSVVLDVYSDVDRVVIPPQNGHQPAVVVSIGVHAVSTFAETPEVVAVISELKAALGRFGIREL